MDLGHWQYPGEFDVNEWFGFVYRIINLTNNMEYIGKKQFFSTQRKPVKGKTRRKVVKKETDWKTYQSSSEYLKASINELGEDKFLFLIESLHKTKGSLFYAEIDAQIFEDVLRAKLPSGERKYYNRMVGNIKFLPPEEVPEETRMKISQKLKERYSNPSNFWYNQMTDDEKRDWDEKYRIGKNNSVFRGKTDEEIEQYIIDRYRGENNPMFGRTGKLSPRYGITHTDETKQQISDKLKGRFAGELNPMYGKNPHDYMAPEALADLKKRMSHPGEQNGMYGKSVYDIVSPEKAAEMKQKISKAQKGKRLSQDTKDKMAAAKQGPQRKSICPHCGKEGGASMMTRYHFDNCKMKKEGQ